MKYQNIKNQKVATVISQNDKTKVVTLEYEDGKTTDITSSTLKRWWKLIENDEVAGDGTPLAEVGKEIAEQAKKKASEVKEKVQSKKQEEDSIVDNKKELAKKAMKEAVEKQKREKAAAQKSAKADKKKPAKEMNPHVKEGLQFIFDIAKKQKDEIFSPANGMNMRTLKVGGHMYCKVDFSNKGFRIAFKSSALPKNVKAPDRTLNHMFDYVYIFEDELTAKDKDFLSKALASAREYRIARNSASTKKEDK